MFKEILYSKKYTFFLGLFLSVIFYHLMDNSSVANTFRFIDKYYLFLSVLLWFLISCITGMKVEVFKFVLNKNLRRELKSLVRSNKISQEKFEFFNNYSKKVIEKLNQEWQVISPILLILSLIVWLLDCFLNSDHVFSWLNFLFTFILFSLFCIAGSHWSELLKIKYIQRNICIEYNLPNSSLFKGFFEWLGLD